MPHGRPNGLKPFLDELAAIQERREARAKYWGEKNPFINFHPVTTLRSKGRKSSREVQREIGGGGKVRREKARARKARERARKANCEKKVARWAVVREERERRGKRGPRGRELGYKRKGKAGGEWDLAGLCIRCGGSLDWVGENGEVRRSPYRKGKWCVKCGVKDRVRKQVRDGFKPKRDGEVGRKVLVKVEYKVEVEKVRGRGKRKRTDRFKVVESEERKNGTTN